MKKLPILILLLLSLIACNNTSKNTEETEKEDITTFYFIRHAEKQKDQGSDPELTEAGHKRAQAWVNFFMLKDVDHVISSDYKRTKQTASPLAKAKKLETKIYDVRATTGLDLLKKYRGETVVLFGHSNTINAYTNQLQNDSIYNQLDESDYDHYFYVRVSDSGKSSGVKEVMDFMQE